MAIDTHVISQPQELTLDEKSVGFTKQNGQLVNPVIESAEFAVHVSSLQDSRTNLMVR